MEFVNGVNRPFIHSVVHQPVDDRQPGIALKTFGQNFNRHETWAEMARPWMDYIARTSFLLQQGRNVADVAYFYGEEAPVAVQALGGYPADVPRRYGYDFVSADSVLNQLLVDHGELVSKGGARYKALFLGGTSSHMTLPLLRKLAAFVDAGATVVGDAPMASPSMEKSPAEFAALVNRLWKRAGDGKGAVIASKDIEGVLASRGLRPDFAYAGQPDSEIPFVHRHVDDGDLYYLANRKPRIEKIEARFRVTGKAPQIWRADTGKVAPVSYRIEGDETVVPLDIAANESVFVLFRDPATAPSRIVEQPRATVVATVEGPWDVAFQPGRGAPAKARFLALGSLSEHTYPGIRYFSGTATYSRNIDLPKSSGKWPVKVEAAQGVAESIAFLTGRGIPVIGHVGLRPQAVHLDGGFKARGRTRKERERVLAEAKATDAAGAIAMVVEGVTPDLAAEITAAVSSPTIGIGASEVCDGQILVTEDMLGLFEWTPKFVRRYSNLREAIGDAISAYAADVRSGAFPAKAEQYLLKDR